MNAAMDRIRRMVRSGAIISVGRGCFIPADDREEAVPLTVEERALIANSPREVCRALISERGYRRAILPEECGPDVVVEASLLAAGFCPLVRSIRAEW